MEDEEREYTVEIKVVRQVIVTAADDRSAERDALAMLSKRDRLTAFEIRLHGRGPRGDGWRPLDTAYVQPNDAPILNGKPHPVAETNGVAE